jgi:hypothetical protein
VLANRAILLGGHQSMVPFSTSLGLAWVEPNPASIGPDPGAKAVLTFRSGIDLPDGLTGSHAFGWFSPTAQSDQAISPGASVNHGLTVSEAAYRLEAEVTDLTGAPWLDACLYDDGGASPGQWDQEDGELACARTPAEPVRAGPLPAGQYWLRIEGSNVTSSPARYDLLTTVVPSSSDGALAFQGLPTSVAANQPVNFAVQAQKPPVVGQRALLVLGPQYLTDVIEVSLVAQPGAAHKAYLPLVLEDSN